MSESEVRLAISVPTGLIEGMDDDSRAVENGFRMERNVLTFPESEENLGFDPITGTAIIWIAIKFIGKAAVTGAVSTISKLVYERLRDSAQKGQRYDITVRFATGESMIIPIDRPLDLKTLEDMIRRNALS